MYPEQCPQGSIAVAYPLTFSHARDGDTVNREPPAAHVFFSQHLHHPLGVDAQQQQYESQLVSHIQPLMPWHPSTYGDLGQAFSDHWPPNHYTSPTEYCELASANHLQIQHMRGKTKRASLYSDRRHPGQEAKALFDMLLNIKSVVTAMEKRLPVLEEHAAQRVSKIDPTTSGQRVMAISPTKSIGPIRPGASGVDLRLDNHRVAAHDLLDCTSIPRPPKPIAQGVTQDNDMIRSETERHLQLHSSYEDHINWQYPILDLGSLRDYLREFHRSYGTDPESPSAPSSRSGNTSRWQAKRRRRQDDHDVELIPPSPSDSHAQERTLTNAIVYLILALGRTCGSDYPAKDLLSTQPMGLPSNPFFGDTGSAPAGPPQTDAQTGISREMGVPDLENEPGFAYYGKAGAILGDFCDSNELAHAQACILASLYMGRMAAKERAGSWIDTALRAKNNAYDAPSDGLSGATEGYGTIMSTLRLGSDSGHFPSFAGNFILVKHNARYEHRVYTEYTT
ncbi:hypothetical protein KCU99_g10111, partial [Aureobasidium melanogenum]